MSFTPLHEMPWRRCAANSPSPGPAWVNLAELNRLIDRWHAWLHGQPDGNWLLINRDPLHFTAALLALWESGRSAVLPADDRPDTLQRIEELVSGNLPALPPEYPADGAVDIPRQLSPSHPAVILFTSGSSGLPVALPKRLEQLDAELQVQSRLWPLGTGAAVISQVSHQHIYGLLTGLLHPLCSGTPFCGNTSHYPEVLLKRLQEASAATLQATVISSPSVLSRLPENLDWNAPPDRLFSSGAPLASTDAQRCESLLQAPVIEIYGSTETGGIAWRQQSRRADWRPLPGVELDFTQPCLAIRSPFLAEPEQWWRHSDHAQPTEQGFQLLGRADRIAKVGGKRISLTRIEHDLQQATGVLTACCSSLDERDGRLVAVVAMEDSCLPHYREQRLQLTRQLRHQLAQSLEPIAIPRLWRFVRQLPSNAQGKLDRSLLEKLFADRHDRTRPRWLGLTTLSPHHARLELEVPEHLVYLEGHFDSYSLVPGVVQIQWAIDLAEEQFACCCQVADMDRLKFQQPLRPGMRFTLELELSASALRFSFDSCEGRHSSGTLKRRAETSA
ncbi:AMP-binding protein [Halopseudomonas salegens]|uniref:Acyl-coenzyme A synthetase/AMP-(Fatty) acid ligase n=1 Tax=Halopseudomonas salegens TaxID=1434072 RepID=A0A1H2GW82_9GAMM|nr:AMP-binding protein [Halopseudomonas salegens]SDU23874.1 Acyl-coenzyme A synthetase/AMP-(fatty) acid ligase [Halopseudomonas salegens]